MNLWGGFIIIGVMCTTFFAGLSNLIGASRVLVRMAEDKLFGSLMNPFMHTVGGNNPIVAVLFSWLIALVCSLSTPAASFLSLPWVGLEGVLMIGALNTIAQITSIFFLLSYVGVNLACLALDLASAPNFRPQAGISSSTPSPSHTNCSSASSSGSSRRTRRSGVPSAAR